MYKVLDSYQRFDQKNTVSSRVAWDPLVRYLIQQRGDAQLRFIERDIAGLLADSLGTGINTPNSGLTSWDPLPIPGYVAFPDMWS